MDIKHNRKSPSVTIVIAFVFFSYISLMGADLSLPFLPAWQEHFGIPIHSIQITVGIYLFGLAGSQLFFGLLNDYFSPRLALICGSFLLTVASLLFLISPTYNALIFCRFFQGFGAGAGLIAVRSIAGSFPSQTAAKLLASVSVAVGLSPFISPLIGRFLLKSGDIYPFFVTLGIYALLMTVVAIIFSSAIFSKSSNNIRPLARTSLREILSHPAFWRYAIPPYMAYAIYYSFLTYSPFLSENDSLLNLYYFSLAISFLVGSFVCRYALNVFSLKKCYIFGLIIFFIGGILFSLISMPFQLSAIALSWLIIAAISCNSFANGFLLNLGVSFVVTIFKNNSGTAAGLYGILQFAVGGIATTLVGFFTDPLFFGIFCFTLSLVGIIAFILIRPK